ncbi:RNase H family protein [Vibrio splendidus]|nr:RNase H family protein [Vibrio splendidus]MCC4880379.1 hypothetical protein [Vibrio splendidus]
MINNRRVSASEVLQNYTEATKGINDVVHILHKETPYVTQPITIYTDGSTKGGYFNEKGKGFSGWSWVAENKQGEMGSRYGSLTHADSTEAELQAILNALTAIQIPSDVMIVTDSQHAISYLNHIDQLMNVINEVGVDNVKDGDVRIGHVVTGDFTSHLKVLCDIKKQLDSNDMIASLKLEWVRAHVLDEYRGKSIYLDAASQSQWERVNQLYGNFHSDFLASKGTDRAIELAVFDTMHKSAGQVPSYSSMPDNHPVRLARKNFENSFASRIHAMDAIIKRGIDNYEHFKVDGMLGRDTFDKLIDAEKVWKKSQVLSEQVKQDPSSYAKRTELQSSVREYRQMLGLKLNRNISIEGRRFQSFHAEILSKKEEPLLKSDNECAARIDKFKSKYSMFSSAVMRSGINPDIIQKKLENEANKPKGSGLNI